MYEMYEEPSLLLMQLPAAISVISHLAHPSIATQDMCLMYAKPTQLIWRICLYLHMK